MVPVHRIPVPANYETTIIMPLRLSFEKMTIQIWRLANKKPGVGWARNIEIVVVFSLKIL
jgi:hypothetical protein